MFEVRSRREGAMFGDQTDKYTRREYLSSDAKRLQTNAVSIRIRGSIRNEGGGLGFQRMGFEIEDFLFSHEGPRGSIYTKTTRGRITANKLSSLPCLLALNAAPLL
jgi:hypothetical protein